MDLSIAIPVVVGNFILIKIPNVKPLTFLPPVYAFINAITAFFKYRLYSYKKKENNSS